MAAVNCSRPLANPLANGPLIWLMLLSSISCLIAVSAADPAAADPPPCGINLRSPQVADAVRSLPAETVTGRAWATDPRTFEGNFDPCATLSTAMVTIEGATVAHPSPR